ncbi:MAG: chemotaxis protein CheW [Gemmatimonadaceae bacterium]|nr:chemotaxis protein CheW [Gemmatimonadaceae bacterium]
MADETLATRRFLLFQAGSFSCACPLDQVREIIPARSPTRLPGAPGWVRGLINVRGTLVTVADLRLRLGGDVVSDAGRSIVIIDGVGKRVGVYVDQVRDVRAIGDDALEAVEQERSVGGVFGLVARVEGSPVLVCDPEALVRSILDI